MPCSSDDGAVPLDWGERMDEQHPNCQVICVKQMYLTSGGGTIHRTSAGNQFRYKPAPLREQLNYCNA